MSMTTAISKTERGMRKVVEKRFFSFVVLRDVGALVFLIIIYREKYDRIFKNLAHALIT